MGLNAVFCHQEPEKFTACPLSGQNTLSMSRKNLFLRAVPLLCAALFLGKSFAAAQGLGFQGMNFGIDQRTSYDVFGGRAETFADSLVVSFDLYTEPSADFGYFLRIKDRGFDCRIWNLSFDARGDSVVLRFNEEGRSSLIKAILPHEDLRPLYWYPLKLKIDLLGNRASLDVAGHRFESSSFGLPDVLTASVFFGRSDHLIDVPSFAIRNLRISSSSRGFFFPLDNTDGSLVTDAAYRVLGKVENPLWLVNNSLKWSEVAQFAYPDIAGACYNPRRKEFYYFTRTQFTALSLQNGETFSRDFPSQCPVQMKLGNCFVSEDGASLYAYELYNEDVPVDSPSTARLDLDSFRWEVLSRDQLPMPLHHHAAFTNPATGRYTILGGFGNMLYNGSFYEFDASSGHWSGLWSDLGGDGIYPRYFTSAGSDGRYVYIYGGMGNECGEQVVGRRYFYDLHRIDPSTGECEKLWELDRKALNGGEDGGDMVPVRSLIVDSSFFYTLCYPEYISRSALGLYRFSIADGSPERLCDDIPIASDKMRTNANLYLDRDLGRFFATVQEFPDDIRSTLKIYSLSYPPLQSISGLSDSGRRSRVFLRRWGLLSGLAAAALIALGAYLIYKHRRRTLLLETRTGAPKRAFRSVERPDSIYLFGDFTVIDHEGADITPLFSPQQILILCLLIKRGEKGMSSKRLSSILWPDKEEDKVKNSRGVAINNLRKSLARLQGAGIFYREGRYYLSLSGDCFCDLFALQEALKDDSPDKDLVFGVLSRGKFLRGVDDEIFDEFKDSTDAVTVPLMEQEIALRFRERDYEAVYEIGEMLSKIDPVNEDAMRTVVRALKRQKRVEEALVVYSAFCADYKKNCDADFPTPFREI